jgi:hypothetical protein
VDDVVVEDHVDRLGVAIASEQRPQQVAPSAATRSAPG